MDSNLLSAFLSACQQDPAMLEFAKNRQVSLRFVLTDANLEFYLSFNNGEFKAALGAPPSNADLTARTTAEIFDGLMSGKVNGTTAAMSGRLRFSGDTIKGMALQRVQKDMMRLYTQAKTSSEG